MKKLCVAITVISLLVTQCINALPNLFSKSSSAPSLATTPAGSSGNLQKASSMPDIRSPETTQTKVQLAKIISNMAQLPTSDELKLAFKRGLEILQAKKGAFDDAEYNKIVQKLNATLQSNLNRVCKVYKMTEKSCEKEKASLPLPLYQNEKEEFYRSLLK